TITGGSGTGYINASTGNQTISLGSGAATVLAASGDHVSAGSGAATIIFGPGTATVDLGINHGPATLAESDGPGADTVMGFNETQDAITLGSHDTITAVMNSAQPSSVISNSTILTFADGSQLTLVGVAEIHPGFFK